MIVATADLIDRDAARGARTPKNRRFRDLLVNFRPAESRKAVETVTFV
jgi:hypothetical protein